MLAAARTGGHMDGKRNGKRCGNEMGVPVG